jgi:hypothetical protein
MVDPINDIRIIGGVALCLLITIAVIGMEWEARVSKIFLSYGSTTSKPVDFFPVFQYNPASRI